MASDAWTYNIVESICLALLVDPQGDREIIKAQEAMKATLEDWIPKILAAQEPDGHLQTYFTLNDLEHWSVEHRRDHEGYVAGYFLDAAVVHYEMTNGKDTRLYKGARKLADCWYNNLGPAPKKSWYNGHQGMEMALVRLGRLVNRAEGEGKGNKYIELAKFLLDCRKDGGEHDQSHAPVTHQYQAVGHAVRATYSYAAMAGVAMETDNVDYQSAVASIWKNLVHRKYYITGGVGSAIEMVQVTDYPWSGEVAITVNPAAEKEFSVKVRVPRRDVSDLYTGTPRSDGITSITLNGATIMPPVEKGYAVIRRSWKAGDRIDLVLPMNVQRVKGLDKIAATEGRVALRYGPLVYSVELVDQALDQALEPTSALSAEWRGKLLGGVMVIKGTWGDGSELLAVPNYARENRAAHLRRHIVRSMVWMKDQ